jgi:hypothetical protein
MKNSSTGNKFIFKPNSVDIYDMQTNSTVATSEVNHQSRFYMLGLRYDHLHDVIIHFLTYVYMRFYLSKELFEEFYGKMIQSA